MPRSHPNVTLAQLRYLVASATHLSMTDAALELHVAQSAVSTAIAALERSLGVQLFIRQRSRGLVLTEAGERFLSDSRALLGHLDEISDRVRGQHHDVRGTLRLACMVTLAPFVLPRLIAEVERQHPRLRIEVIEADAQLTSELLLSGGVEGAIGYDFGAVHDLSFEHLYRAAPYVIVGPDHPLARRRRVRLAELAGEDLVLLDLPQSRPYFLNLLTTAGIEPHIRYSSRSYETVRSLVSRGLGFSILNHRPRSSQTYDGGTIKALPLADELPGLEVSFIRVANVRPTARLQVIESLARDLFTHEVGPPEAA